jgi:MFS family permease
MYSAAAGWLMTSLNSNAVIVSLVQVANSLPLFLLALPAGAIADLFDRRRLILVLEILTTIVSAIFALLVSLHRVDPSTLLLFALAVAILGALETPAWQAIVPQLVPSEALASAVATNSVGINVSRAIGPALGGVVILTLGIAMPFWFDAFSNLGVIMVILLWRVTPRPKSALPSEHLRSAVRGGLRYARNSRPLRAALVRASGFFVFASAYWALLPLTAREQIHGGPTLYGLLLGSIGLSAIVGALVLPRIVERLGSDVTVVFGGLLTAAALVLFAVANSPTLGLLACLFAGVSWIAVVATLNVSAQRALPDWVRGRGLAIYTAAFFGTMSLGSVIWGYLAEHTGLRTAQLVAAAGAALAALLTRRAKLSSGPLPDLTPSMHWPPPVLSGREAEDPGQVMVTVDYRVQEHHRQAFLTALDSVARGRRRDGAYDWRIFVDSAHADRFIEVFFVDSWLEHMRQHRRVTVADQHAQERLRELLNAEPVVTHYIEPLDRPSDA